MCAFVQRCEAPHLVARTYSCLRAASTTSRYRSSSCDLRQGGARVRVPSTPAPQGTPSHLPRMRARPLCTQCGEPLADGAGPPEVRHCTREAPKVLLHRGRHLGLQQRGRVVQTRVRVAVPAAGVWELAVPVGSRGVVERQPAPAEMCGVSAGRGSHTQGRGNGDPAHGASHHLCSPGASDACGGALQPALGCPHMP